MRFNFEDKFRETIRSIDHPIAKVIASLEGKDNGDTDINWVDVCKKDGLIVYIPDSKITDKIERYYKKRTPEEIAERVNEDKYRLRVVRGVPDKITAVSRVESKVGRVIQKLLTLSKTEFKNKDVEDFVNKYVAYENLTKGVNFKVLKGNEIIYGYRRENYSNMKGTSNDLWGSCMTDHDAKLFDIYTKNSNCSLLVCLTNGGKVIGRCLLWDAKMNGRDVKLMDRVYAIKQSEEQMFKDWAREHGYIHRNYNNNNSDSNAYELFDAANNRGINMRGATVQLENSKFLRYPYLDSFRYLDRHNNILTNDYNYTSRHRCIDLRSTGGGFGGDDGLRLAQLKDGTVVDERLCVRSNVMNCHILKENAIEVFFNKRTSDRDWADKTCDVVYSEVDKRHYFKNRSKFSKYHNSWLSKDDIFYFESGDDYISLTERTNFKEKVTA